MNKIKLYFLAASLLVALASCTKTEDISNPAANAATTGAANLSLNNRLQAGFIIDSSTLHFLPAGSLPSGYNKFRKQLTYDTLSAANKPVVYDTNTVITILTYVKGDDSAINRRSINFRFFGVPTLYPGGRATSNWIKPLSNPPQSAVQAAEDSIRNFAPRSIDVLNTVTQSSIRVNTTAPFEITKVKSEVLSGISYSTYLIKLSYTIPPSLSGKLVSINFSVSSSTIRNDIGNVNWNYAFRVR